MVMLMRGKVARVRALVEMMLVGMDWKEGRMERWGGGLVELVVMMGMRLRMGLLMLMGMWG